MFCFTLYVNVTASGWTVFGCTMSCK